MALSSVHKSPQISNVSLIPGASTSSNMSSTFGQDVLRLTAYTEEDFQMIGLLTKLLGPSDREPTLETLDLIERGLEGRLAKLREIRTRCKDQLEDYLAAAGVQQQAARPFKHFKSTMITLRNHVVQALGPNQRAVEQFFSEFAEVANLDEITPLVNAWKSEGRASLTDADCDKLIDFVLAPANRHMEFSRERALLGVRGANIPNYYSIPEMPKLSPEHREEMRLSQWLIGASAVESDVLLQFFLHLNGESFRENSSTPTTALAHLQIAEKVQQQVKFQHTKLGLARAFSTTIDDENWRVTIETLTEKFEALCFFAEAIGLEHSAELRSFVENFSVNSVKAGAHNSLITVYGHENSEHWWPLAWLGIEDKEGLLKRGKEVRELIAEMPALEIRSRLQLLLDRTKPTTQEHEWEAVENWV